MRRTVFNGGSGRMARNTDDLRERWVLRREEAGDAEGIQRLHTALTCPVCGMPLVHSRLRGYYCHFEAHNQERVTTTMNDYDRFIQSRDRNWWRAYYRNLCHYAEAVSLKRPLTLAERKELVREMYSRASQGILGSFSVTVIMWQFDKCRQEQQHGL